MEPHQANEYTAEVTRLKALADWWAEQAEHIAWDHRQLRWFYLAGGPLALAAGIWDWRAGAGVAALCTLAWIQGNWLCTVHRWEYTYNLREARRDLWALRKSHMRAAPVPLGEPPAPTQLPPHPRRATVRPRTD
jgi:hypothetical protein